VETDHKTLCLEAIAAAIATEGTGATTTSTALAVVEDIQGALLRHVCLHEAICISNLDLLLTCNTGLGAEEVLILETMIAASAAK
jgi:hypothetical protein